MGEREREETLKIEEIKINLHLSCCSISFSYQNINFLRPAPSYAAAHDRFFIFVAPRLPHPTKYFHVLSVMSVSVGSRVHTQPYGELL
jgi:hypothetical protein